MECEPSHGAACTNPFFFANFLLGEVKSSGVPRLWKLDEKQCTIHMWTNVKEDSSPLSFVLDVVVVSDGFNDVQACKVTMHTDQVLYFPYILNFFLQMCPLCIPHWWTPTLGKVQNGLLPQVGASYNGYSVEPPPLSPIEIPQVFLWKTGKLFTASTKILYKFELKILWDLKIASIVSPKALGPHSKAFILPFVLISKLL